MLDAARTLLAFLRSRAPAIAEAHGLTYPEPLDRLAGARLLDLDAPGTAPYP